MDSSWGHAAASVEQAALTCATAAAGGLTSRFPETLKHRTATHCSSHHETITATTSG